MSLVEIKGGGKTFIAPMDSIVGFEFFNESGVSARRVLIVYLSSGETVRFRILPEDETHLIEYLKEEMSYKEVGS